MELGVPQPRRECWRVRASITFWSSSSCAIVLTRTAPAGADETVCMQMPSIFVRTLNGSVSVPQEGSVQNLKEQIEARSGIAAESVRLAYNGHILQDDELLEELESQITLDL